jgi:DNA repair protein RecO (recombination protein O)
MLVKTRAIALHYVKYAESSIIACLYTEKFGRQSYIINSVRTKKPAFPASFFLPLTLLETDVYYRPGRDIQRIKEMTCMLHFHSIPFQVTKSTIALFMAELLFKTLKEEEANPALFDFLIHAIQLLDMKDEGMQNFHLVFLIHYMKFLGIYPFQSEIKGMIDYQPVFNLPADAGVREKKGFEQLVRCSLTQLGDIRLTNKTRSFLLERIMEFYMIHLDQITGIRSLQVLKDVFQ